MVEFADGLQPIKSVKLQILAYIPNPEYGQLLNTTVTNKPTIIKPVKSMLDYGAMLDGKEVLAVDLDS